MKNEHDQLPELYLKHSRLLDSQAFEPDKLDYGVLDRHVPFLKQMEQITNSAISVFDLYQKEHIYLSDNYATLWNVDAKQAEAEGAAYFDRRVHPDDLVASFKAAYVFLSMAFQLPVEDRKNYKLANEYRIRRDDSGQYARVTEHFQCLELDPDGRVWLALCTLDLSPDGDLQAPFRSRLFNLRSGESIAFNAELEPADTPLSLRELEVLQLIALGLASKQIAERLYISVHTVNTHRQRIIEKLQVNNTVEAVRLAVDAGYFVN